MLRVTIHDPNRRYCLCGHAYKTHGRQEAGGFNPVCRATDCPCNGFETVELRQERERHGPADWSSVKSVHLAGGYTGQ
jgi:hypothetical protein